MLTDYHVHIYETGGFDPDYLRRYAERAAELGIAEWGLSEHAYFFAETRGIVEEPWAEARRRLRMEEYVALVDAARAEGLPLKFGIEMDYVPGKEERIARFLEAYPFDYVIGSVHWIGSWGIDLKEFRHEYERRDIREVYRAYFDQIISMADSRLVDIVGHIDLVKIFGYRPADPELLDELYEEVAEAVARGGLVVEISTAGLRKPVGEIYPARELLVKLHARGVPIVLSSDAHEPENLGYAYDRALALAREVGYREVVVFRGRRREVHPLG
ncbi:MAG: histidinol-phosphatase HisJ family protein [Brockia lithotrophica]|nr:histidinol-phosphatase HisJ family protein [Brockia lithotrophica]